MKIISAVLPVGVVVAAFSGVGAFTSHSQPSRPALVVLASSSSRSGPQAQRREDEGTRVVVGRAATIAAIASWALTAQLAMAAALPLLPSSASATPGG